MDILDRIAEVRIADAIERGDFDDLPGTGQPLQLDDLAQVPEELRAAYKILKNSGFLPPELQLRKDIREAEELLAQAADPAGRNRALARLLLLRQRLDLGRGGKTNLQSEEQYYQKLVARFAD
ncbi:MAG: DnaJ family domain-containing protein [Gammaproteobacteria bacterium]